LKLLLVIIFFLFCAFNAQAAEIHQIKAAFLLNFLKFARFSQTLEQMTICIMDNKLIFDEISSMAPKEIEGHELRVKLLNTSDDYKECLLLYSSKLVKDLRTNQLLVTDENEGGIIEFITKGEKLSFGIRLRACQKSGIEFPAQVLSLAVPILEDTKEGTFQKNEQVSKNLTSIKKNYRGNINYRFNDVYSHYGFFSPV